jgi:hypothetical protein
LSNGGGRKVTGFSEWAVSHANYIKGSLRFEFALVEDDGT